jgi:protein O-mannosyl-transferase
MPPSQRDIDVIPAGQVWRVRSAAAARPLAIAGLVLLVFGRSLAGQWVGFDDQLHVTENPRLAPASWDNLLWLWTHPYQYLFIPVSYTLYWLEVVASRWAESLPATATPAPTLFRSVSLILHAANAVLVFRLLSAPRIDWRGPLLGAMLFAVHPLQVESVCWVSEQRGLLAAFFSLLALERFGAWAAASPTPSPWQPRALCATGLFVLALLSKPSALPLPLVALAWPGFWAAGSRNARLTLAATWLGIACGAAILTRLFQPASIVTHPTPLWLRPTIVADAIAFYAAKLVVPLDLCVMYGRTPLRVARLPLTPLVAVTTAAALGGLWCIPRMRKARAPVAVSVAALLPTLGFVPFAFQNSSTVADRYAYLALLGPAIALCSLVAWRPRWAPALAAGVVAACAGVAWQQVGTWGNTARLATQAVTVEPGVAWGWAVLSGVSLNKGDAVAATDLAARALSLEPGNDLALLNLAAALGMRGDYERSQTALDRLNPAALSPASLWLSHYTRGLNLLHLGHDEAAAAALLRARELDPLSRPTGLNLAIVLTRLERLDEAATLLRTLVDANPDDAAAWIALGNVAYRGGNAREAADLYSRAVVLRPRDPDGFLNRARARLLANDRPGAADDVAAAAALGADVDQELANDVGLAPE